MKAYKIRASKEESEPAPIFMKAKRIKTELIILTFLGFILIYFGSFIVTIGAVSKTMDNSSLSFYTGVFLTFIGLLLTPFFVRSASYLKLIGSVYGFYITLRAWLTIRFIDKISIATYNINLATEEAGLSGTIPSLYSPAGLRPILVFLFLFSLCMGIILCVLFIFEYMKNRRKTKELDLKISRLSEEFQVIQRGLESK